MPSGYTYSDYLSAQNMNHNNILSGSRGPVTEKPASYQFGKKTVSGLAAGAASGNPWGAAIGAGVGLLGDVVSYFANKKNSEASNRFNAEQAEAAFARSYAAERAAAMYNSPASQVERLKQAGLSPALALSGGLQPSAMSAPQSAAASSSPPPNAEFNADGLGAFSAAVSSKQADSLISLQQSEGAKTDAERVQVEIDNITRHQQNIAQYESLLASAALDNATKDKIKFLMGVEREQMVHAIENLDANTQKLNEETNFIKGAQTAVANSQVSLNAALGKNANAQATYTSGALTKKTNQETETSYQSGRVQQYTANQLKISSNLSQKKLDAISNFLQQHGFGDDAMPFALDFVDNMAKQSGLSLSDVSIKTLGSWFSGDNWIPFISQSLNRSNSKEIAQGYQDVMSENVDKYINSAKNSSDSQHGRLMNEYRSEFALLSKANQKRVDDYISGLKARGVDDDDISERAAYYCHKLYESQQSKK